jgi:hypothetical protein
MLTHINRDLNGGPILHHMSLEKYLPNKVHKPEDGSSLVTLICSAIDIDTHSNGVRNLEN